MIEFEKSKLFLLDAVGRAV